MSRFAARAILGAIFAGGAMTKDVIAQTVRAFLSLIEPVGVAARLVS